ncbi:MAG: LamG domain-containing protein [Candidatus Omnitrophica bacterium]|nr:LamG domain-containing protein [Candidatus Omnitrophota bacterium]
MKKFLLFFLFLGLILFSKDIEIIPRTFYEEKDGLNLVINKVLERSVFIEVDGNIREDDWKKGIKICDLNLTHSRILSDDKNIYISIFAEDYKENERIEVWISPYVKVKDSYYQINIFSNNIKGIYTTPKVIKNEKGEIIGARLSQDFNFNYIKTIYDKEQKILSCELKIPFSEIGIIRGGELAIRIKRIGGEKYLKTDWEIVDLENEKYSFKGLNFGDLLKGENELSLKFENKTGENLRLGLKIEFISESKLVNEVSNFFDLLPLRESDIKWRYKIPLSGYARLKLHLTLNEEEIGSTFTDIFIPEGHLFTLLRERYYKDDKEVLGYLRIDKPLIEIKEPIVFKVYEGKKSVKEYKIHFSDIKSRSFIFKLNLENLKKDKDFVDYTLILENFKELNPLHFYYSNKLSEKTKDLPVLNKVPLFLDNTKGPINNYLIETSVPFPEGHLYNPENVRVINPKTGKELSSEGEIVTRWKPEGSIKWLKLRFINDIDGNYNMDKEILKEDSYINPPLILEYGTKVKRGKILFPLKIEERENEIIVDTGNIKVKFKGNKIIEEIYWDKNKDHIYTEDEKIISGITNYLIDQNGKLYSNLNEEIKYEVEKKGNLFGVIKVSGNYYSEEKEQLCKYIIRFIFYSMCQGIKIEHFWAMDKDSYIYQFKDIGLIISLLNNEKNDYIYFDISEDNKDKFLKEKIIPNKKYLMLQGLYHHHGQFETSAGIYNTYIEEKGIEEEWEINKEIKKIGHWFAVEGEKEIVSLSLRNTWQQFPKSFEYFDKKMVIHFWDSRKRFKEGGFEKQILSFRNEDLIKYFGEVFLKTPGYQNRTGEIWQYIYQNFSGHGKTHEIYLYFDNTIENIINEFEHFQTPILSLPHPKWTIFETEVIPFKTSIKDPNKYPEYEQKIEEYVNSILYLDDKSGNYGFWEYGSGPHFCYRLLNKTENKDEAKFVADSYYRYANHNYGGSEYWWTNYLRSGERKWYDFARRHCVYIGDIAMRYDNSGYADYASYYSWQGSTYLHWAFHPNAMLYNYLFGNFARAEDILKVWRKGILDVTERRDWPRQFEGGNLVNSNGSSLRCSYGLFNQINNLFLISWDLDLGVRMEELAKYLINLESPSGVIPDGKEIPGEPSQTPYFFISLLNYYQATLKSSGVEAMKKLCENYYKNWPCHSYTFPVAHLVLSYDWYLNKRENSVSIAKDLKEYHTNKYFFPGILNIDSHSSNFINLGFPILIRLLDEYGKEVKRYPEMEIKSADFPIVIYFIHKKGKSTKFEYSYRCNPYPILPKDIKPEEKEIKLEILTQSNKLLTKKEVSLVEEELSFMSEKTNYGKFEIPKEKEEGIYKIKITFSEIYPSSNFTLRSTNAEKIVLDTSCNGEIKGPVYFYLPADTKEKKIDSWRSASEKIEEDIYKRNNVYLPLESYFPLVAFEKEKLFWIGENIIEKKVEEVKEEWELGGTKLLKKNEKFEIIIPEEKKKQSFMEGTIEFWYNPSEDNVFPEIFIKKGDKIISGLWYRTQYRNILLSGDNNFRSWPLDPYSACRKPFKKGRWYHISIIHNFKSKYFSIFVNGIGTRFSNREWIEKNWKIENFESMPDSIEFIIKNGEGIIDELRISNSVRYYDGFRPLKIKFKEDKNTLLLYHFD